ncbi:S41 family peptidase [uncultured Paludibaculum sp.]|uniref:S41 family peptidase n=1 Tax=uncultured Paludibaculum sp. TaxID=1765020 RepID=UPI002AAB2883|nr:S41 family peptidase [uncultured Paludibaculum sp.]
MLLRNAAVFLLCLAPVCFGQMTTDQKVADFMQLAGLYAKNYAPYEWKRDVIGFDLYNVKPWLEKVRNSKDDLEFLDVCVRYVASLQDSHDEFYISSDFIADMRILVDIYDGKVLIEGVDRTALPRIQFPIGIGDELVSVDGIPVADLIEQFAPYAANGSGNPVTRRRLAADALTYRIQSYMPLAGRLGDEAVIVVRDADGVESTYTVPWVKTGTPMLIVGPVPGFDLNSAMQKKAAAARVSLPDRGLDRMERRTTASRLAYAFSRGNRGIVREDAEPAEEAYVPEYMRPMKEFQTMQALNPKTDTAGFGFLYPVFDPPLNFKFRLGFGSADEFLSGTFTAGAYNIGFIRIPSMDPTNATTALKQFATEIAYFQANTDGLVIDVMNNGGGSLCYTQSLEQYLFTQPFRGVAYEMRATQTWVNFFSYYLGQAKSAKAPDYVIALYQVYLDQVQQALKENRGRTGSLPVCGYTFEDIQPALDNQGAVAAYSKPILVLTDEFTLSSGEAFTMMLQDAGRATVFGMRTDGGGGNPGTYDATTYSEGVARVTRTFVTRANLVSTPGFPPANHMENVGVYPDIVMDYMTRENFDTYGAPFVDAFTGAIVDMIAKTKQ